MAERPVSSNWGWSLALGVLLIVLGIAAITTPLIATLAVGIMVGWLLLIAGIGQIVSAFGARGWGFLGRLSLGVLYLFIAWQLLTKPIFGTLTLTLLLVGYFVAEGVIKILWAFQLRPDSGWLRLLVGGALPVVLGVMIWLHLPSSAAWAIGLLVGVNLLFSGWTWVTLAIESRRALESSSPSTA